MAAAGGAVIAAAAWRRARAGSPGSSRSRSAGSPTAPSRQSGAARDPVDGGAVRRDRDPGSFELRPEAYRPVAHGLHGPVQRAQPLGQRRRARARPGASSSRPAAQTAREHLAAAGVEHGGDGARARRRRRPAPPASRPATSGSPRALRERAGGGDADPQPGEAARPDADGDPLDVVPGHLRLRQRALEQHEHPRRVAAARAGGRVVARLDHAAVGAAARRRRWPASRCRARRGSRAAHLDPAPVAAGVRERDAAGDRAAAEQRRGLRRARATPRT